MHSDRLYTGWQLVTLVMPTEIWSSALQDTVHMFGVCSEGAELIAAAVANTLWPFLLLPLNCLLVPFPVLSLLLLV